ncbi:chondroitinase family polysaccharide lyase [Alistipes sp.]|uniref:chondroitinase family polysaccharide lyase n=1 Tax=Alistipes sp. TaxID=1872444 RepID=UPI003AF07A35
MKKGLIYGAAALLGLTAAFRSTEVSAAIDARITFETEIPKGFTCDENSRIELSGDRYKDGRQSLRWSWTAPSALHYADYASLMRSARTKGAGIMLWIYNPAAADADLRFTFETPTGEKPYHFDFHMDFTGWRACWIKWNDMWGDHSSQQLSRMTVTTPEGVPNGEIFLDRLTFAEFKLNDQITPDRQIPDNNRNLRRTLWHWARLWEWEQYQYAEPLREPTADEKKMLDRVKSRIDAIVTATMSSVPYINGTIIPRAQANLAKAAIERRADGSLAGAPLLSNDECNRPKGELRLDDIENMLYAFALNSYVNRDDKYDDQFFLVMDHAIDQGFAFGHGNGTNHHYGYNVRKIYDAMWLMRDKIAARGKTGEYVRVLAYWSGLAETRKPYVYGRDELLDAWHTLLTPKLISALMLPTEAEQYRAMKALGVWLSGSLDFTPGTIGGIKPDGTTFHHGGFYPAYSTGAFATIGYYCKATEGTDFTLSEAARRTFKLALMTMADYTDLRDWGLGIAGRHPLNKNGRIPDADVNAFGYLAALGDLTGSGKASDPELAGAFLRLKGTDKELASRFKKEGIQAGPTPSGFFVLNYGATGIHRRGDWMVTLKAYNSDVWGSEIYAKDNRYGRYQSYGTAPIIGSGNPVTAAESGFVQEGWDWNRPPGATTIHLPFEELESPRPGTLMERNPIRFSGASSLEGRNGALALWFVERDYPRFTEGATARKSIFCFDNRLVCIGSGIRNDNASYPTETTLFQLQLKDKGEPMEIDGEVVDAFPFSLSKSGAERLMLSDTKGNFYVVKNSGPVNILRQRQTSPNDKTHQPQSGDFATAYIDHGRAPREAAYEYAVYIQPTNKEIGRIAKKETYEVLRRDNDAHVVRDLETGITGYVLFTDFAGEGLVKSATGETILMERTVADGELVMSVCTPDLGLTEKTYTTAQESQPIRKEVLLTGSWELASQYPGVETVSTDTGTLLHVTCRHGQPVEFRLKKK